MLSGNRKVLFAWKLLVFLLLTNYQTVVILCNDFILLKFLRDLVLIYILVETFARRPGLTKRYLLPLLLLVPFFVWGTVKTGNLGTAFVTLRKYLFPLGILLAAKSFKGLTEEDYDNFIKYLLTLAATLSAWGIFQAHVLKDTFLIDMGYPTIYANAYQRITLRHSYYFGNLGIQRVTSTVSNSNVFGIIMGVTIIAVLLRSKTQLNRLMGWVKLLLVAAGYVLTVSRSNFLAMVVIVIILLWRYVPHKKKLIAAAAACLVGFVVLYIVQDSNGISHKLVNWVVASLSGQESSASGRSSIWSKAIEGIVSNPLGIGFGKTGTTATDSASMYACENSFLAMALDMGIAGAASSIVLVLCILYDLYRCHGETGNDSLARSSTAIVIYFFIVCLFSNHIYDMEAIGLVYLLFGLGSNLLEHPDTATNEERTPQ